MLGCSRMFSATILSVLASQTFRVLVQIMLRGAGGARTHDQRIMSPPQPVEVGSSLSSQVAYRHVRKFRTWRPVELVRDCTLAVCVQSASVASLSAYLSVHRSVISGNGIS